MLEIWYNMPDKNLEALQIKYPVSSVQDYKTEIEALYQFNKKTEINRTPAILLNGKILSRFYHAADLLGIVRTLKAEDE